MIAYLLAGLIGGINSILWGLYGDLMVEKFYLRKVFRTMLFAAAWAVILFVIDPSLPLLIVALVVIALERGTTEVYKALIRNEPQEKYLIPSNPFDHIKSYYKYTLVIIFTVLTLLALYYDPFQAIPPLVIALLIGFVIAIGGMSKDAPYEGFEPLKFFRSPFVALLVYVIIVWLFPATNGIYLLLSIAGGERIISEFYKKILNGKIPGKFKQEKINKVWQQKRKLLLPVYGFHIILLFGLYFLDTL